MRTVRPTARDIEALLAFRTGFERPGRTFYRDDVDGGPYADDVVAFFTIAGGPAWDVRYDPETEVAHLNDPDYIARADLPALRRLITACVRGERFCDGWWGGMLRDAVVQRVLARLESIRIEG